MVRMIRMKLAYRRTLSPCRGWLGATAILGLTLLGLSGCGDPNAVGQMKLNPVKGKVLLADGKPLTGGRVVFMNPERAMEFDGPIESDGSFSIKAAQGEGAPEGSYKVRIEPDTTKPADSSTRTARRKGQNLPYPTKYADETTSGLTATVNAGDNTLEPFKLIPGEATSKSRGER